MENISKLQKRVISLATIVSVIALSLVASVPAGAYVGIVDATVVPGTIDISTPTDIVVSFTTPVEIPASGEVVVIFPSTFGLQQITDVTSTDINGGLTFELLLFSELHISRSGDGDAIATGSVIDDLTILNVTTPPIEDYVGDYTVSIQDSSATTVASGKAQGQVFEDLVTPPAAPLSLTLTSPNGGEVFTGDDETVISWVSNGGIPFAKLYFSSNAGSTYSLIAENLSGSTYNWSVPNIDVSQGKIKVVSVDEYGANVKTDISDGNFEILHTEEVIVIDDVEMPVAHNSLIKGTSLSAVYFFSSDAKRYVFPSEQIFYSWFNNFDDVITVDDSVLASFKIGSRITMAPGSLIKITSDPKVYAIDSDGTKHHVKDEVTASALFGSNWASQVVDIDITQWFDYPTGDQLTTSSEFTSTVPSFPISN
ncbi:hypothetical protein HQ524_03785 [Candidatus Uhrbacteria bacterium]|nr:hypothetical protein [Candidatus Uhrbacteria bacterium]